MLQASIHFIGKLRVRESQGPPGQPLLLVPPDVCAHAVLTSITRQLGGWGEMMAPGAVSGEPVCSLYISP